MADRKYLPTFGELCDRLSIVLLKQIFISENREAYRAEASLILHDIDLLLSPKEMDARDWGHLDSTAILSLLILMLTNREIWLNESKARQGGSEQDKLLKFTHSINGIRSNAKNALSAYFGERIDRKVDALAADLPPEFGNWNLFG